MRIGRLVVAVASCALLVAGCASGEDNNGGRRTVVDIRGSDTMVNLGAALAEAYMGSHQDVDLIVQGGGSGTGIAALLNRNADIAQSSRPMSVEEWDEAARLGIEVREIIIGHDAIVVCVHPDNPVRVLSVAQLGSIYRGEITRWSDVGGLDETIVLLSRDTSSGTFSVFRDLVVRQQGLYPDAEYASDAMMVPSTQFIVDETRRNRRAIGYIGLGYVDATIQAISIDTGGPDTPVSPLVDHPGGFSYPLSRPLFFYVAQEPGTVVVAQYLDFILGADGQKIVSDLHFLPR